LSKVYISFPQAALGDKIEVDTADGPIRLKVPEGTQSGTNFRLRGKGAHYINGRGRGDHIIEINIRTPKNLTRKQKQLLKELEV
jgi:molecular chaperone DnaJ